MSTKDSSFDYREHYNDTKPDSSKLTNSVEARRQRRQAAKKRITIRLDQEVVEQFKALASDDGYQTLINQALREWLAAQSVKELLRSELPEMVKSAVKDATVA